MVAGLMNAKDNDPEVYKHLVFVAYTIVNQVDMSHQEQIHKLQEEKFETPYARWVLGTQLTDDYLTGYLDGRREHSFYEIDGLVLDVAAVWKRNIMNPTRETLNPAYSVKYKVASADNVAITTVKMVEWNISKDALIKPRVHIEPVDLMGVTLRHASGFNAKFIYDNGVGPGAKVQITRSGDVIPFIQKVVERAVPQMPGMVPEQVNWIWNWTTNDDGVQVDAKLETPEEHDEVVLQQLLHFATTLDIEHLKEGTIRKMASLHEYHDFMHASLTMLQYSEEDWKSGVGANGRKIYASIQKKLNNMPLYLLMGALPFFDRGVGTRKFKKLIRILKIKNVGELGMLNKAQITIVDGFELKTAYKIMNGMNDFFSFLHALTDYVTLDVPVEDTDGAMTGEKIVFTGFRDKELKALVEAEGGTIQSGFSGKTTIVVTKNPKSNSGKIKKARERGTRIVGLDEFKEMLS